MTEITGKLTDYALMDEGVNKGRYAARIDDKPYPVLKHVDVFLMQRQKGETVDVLFKDVDGVQWINKITKSKKPLPVSDKPELTTAERMVQAGFTQSSSKPAEPKETMSAAEVSALTARGEEAKREKAHAEEMAAKSTAAKGNNTEEPCTSPKTPEDKPAPDMDGINRRARECQEQMRIENDARKAAQNPAPVVQMVPVHIAPIAYSEDEMLLLRNVIAKGCSEPEFKLLMYMANTYGLDPLLKQIWAVKRNENTPALIFAGRDGMLAIAHRSGQFDGMQSGVVYDDDRKPISAWCEIWRKDMSHSFKTEVPFSEYNTGFSVWKTNPSAMILKVSEAVCLRKAFSVSGLYSPEEIDTGVR